MPWHVQVTRKALVLAPRAKGSPPHNIPRTCLLRITGPELCGLLLHPDYQASFAEPPQAAPCLAISARSRPIPSRGDNGTERIQEPFSRNPEAAAKRRHCRLA